MKTLLTPILALGLVATAAAQNQLVRGKVEDVPSTSRFILDCTTIPLVSSKLNLNALVGQQWNLDVINVGSPSQPVLDVQAATAATKIMDMGNLRFGRAERWQVNYTPGSMAGVFVQLTSATSYLPAGALGTWLLGFNSLHVRSGVTNGQGQFEFNLTMPTIPSLVGVSFTSQALVLPPSGSIVVTNPDCKEVRND
jgi:hypothetical protein